MVAMTQLRTCQSSGPFTPDIPRHVSERLSVKCQQPNGHITNGTGAIVTIRSDRLDTQFGREQFLLELDGGCFAASDKRTEVKPSASDE